MNKQDLKKLSGISTASIAKLGKGENITTEKTQDILVTPGNFNIGGGFKSSKFKL